MKILFLQISDIHFRSANNTASERAQVVFRALQSIDSEIENYFIIMTGDVTWGGSPAEYEVAHSFFDQLKHELLASKLNTKVEEIFIPGNHDCSLKPDSPVREVLLSSIRNNPKPPYRPEDEIISQCVTVQDNFFNFLKERMERDGGTYSRLDGTERLFYQKYYHIDKYTICFNCYNSAWMSQIHEKQGELFIPLNQSVTKKGEKGADVVISLFHHPYGWLEANNSRAFRKEVELLSDIVMTGHEHVAEQFKKGNLNGAAIEYFEGAVFQENGASNSGFNVLLIDLGTRERRILLYEWNDEIYSCQHESSWQSLDYNAIQSLSTFRNTQEFEERLHDVGAAFSHPTKTQLHLEDLFIYPDFDELTYSRERNNNVLFSELTGDKLLDYVLRHSKALFIGPDRAGKTSLAKKLYLDLQEKGLVPLLLDGKDIKSPDIRALEKIEEEAVKDQYGLEMLEKYNQLLPSQRVILVDNFHLIKLHARGLNKLVDYWASKAERQIVLAGDLFQIHNFARHGDEESALLEFKHCEIREFGVKMRGRLIEKWFNLGRELTANDREIAQKARDAENLITTLLGKSLLPSHPLFVLTILQLNESQTNPDTPYGAYGYYYEALITSTLQNRSKNIPIDMLYPFISRIAYRMFDSKLKSLSYDEFSEVSTEYQNLYQVKFNDAEMLMVLEEARILKKDGEDQYSFNYKYTGYYFVARYLRDHLHSKTQREEQRKKIKEMVSKIYAEDYSNILIFLIYLTKDDEIIAEIVRKSQSLFQKTPPCNLEEDILFAYRFHQASPLQPFQLESGSEQDHRDQHRATLDSIRQQVNEGEEESMEDDLITDRESEDADLDSLLQFNVAFKTLQIMGQILRNFPGTLLGDDKTEIARESYLLGLRTLNVLFGLVESDIDGFRELIAQMLQEQKQYPTQTEEQRNELSKKVDNFCYAIMWNTAHSFIKRISYAVGSEYLKETYKHVNDPRIPLSINIINISIKLDHFKKFPEQEVVRTFKNLEKNPFTANILKCMVRDHFYLYPSDHNTRQSVCSQLDIKFNDPKMLTVGQKKQ